MKIGNLTENMFSQAVGLSQSGRMKSTIHAFQNDIFIMNMDYTIMLRFRSPDNFEAPINFFANDYESDTFSVVDGKISFKSRSGNMMREKITSIPNLTFDEVKGLWEKYEVNKKFPLIISKAILELLDDGLSHVEFHKVDTIKIIQKDIYSGAKVIITKNDKSTFDFNFESGTFSGVFPIGLRTNDFKNLFAFSEELVFYFQENFPYVYFENKQQTMSGFLATCIYDELAEIG